MSEYAAESDGLTDDGQLAEASAPAETAPAAPAPTGDGTAEWQGPSQQEWEATQQYLQQIAPFAEQFQQFQQELAGFEEPQEYDATDPQQLQQYVDSMVQEQLAPYAPLLGQIAEQEGERIARESLQQIQGEIGDFNQDQAILLAQVFMQQGYTPEQSLVGAAQAVQEYEKQIGESAVQAYKDGLAAAAGATQQPGMAQGAAVENPGTPTGRDRYEEIAQRWLERGSPSTFG